MMGRAKSGPTTDYSVVAAFEQAHKNSFKVEKGKDLVKVVLRLKGFRSFRWVRGHFNAQFVFYDPKDGQVSFRKEDSRINEAKYALYLEYRQWESERSVLQLSDVVAN